MAKGIKFDPSMVKNKDVKSKVIDGAVGRISKPNEDIAKLKLRRRYYNLETGEPLPLREMQSRLTDTYTRIDRLSVEVMFDLYFIWSQWGSFYIRKESFAEYVNENLPISRSYAYDIIKSVRLMIQYAEEKNVSYGTTLSIESLAKPVEAAGLKKLKLISQVKNEDARFKILDNLISGQDVSEDMILEINKNELKKLGNKKPVAKDTDAFSWIYKYNSKEKSIVIGEDNNKINFSDNFSEMILDDFKSMAKKYCDSKAKDLDVEVVPVSKKEEEKKELKKVIKKFYELLESGTKPAIIGVDPDNAEGELRDLEFYKKKIKIK